MTESQKHMLGVWIRELLTVCCQTSRLLHAIMDYGSFTVEEIDLLEFTFSEDDKLLQTINLDVYAENTALSSENVSIEMAKNKTVS